MNKIKGDQFLINDYDLNKELSIAATLKSMAKIDIVRAALKDYYIKQRIEDRIKEFKR
jgi:hypothetical protein